MLYKLTGEGESTYHKTLTSIFDELLNTKGVSDKIIKEARFNEIDTNDEEEMYSWLWNWGEEIATEFGYTITEVEKEGD